MALNVLYTTLLLFQQRSVYHSHFSFFIFQFFIFYLCIIVGRHQAVGGIIQTVARITQAVGGIAQAVARTTQAVARITQAVGGITQAVARITQAVGGIAQAVARIIQAVGGIIPTLQQNKHNTFFYGRFHLFINL